MSDFEPEEDIALPKETATQSQPSGLFDDSDSDDDSEPDIGASSAPEETTETMEDKKEPKKKGRLQKKSDLKKKSKKKSSSSNDEGKPMSKKERMEKLAKKRSTTTDDDKVIESLETVERERERRPKKEKKKRKEKGEEGYESGDSYNSGQFVRTREDDDFIDADGEDPDALRELYAEQHFHDERADGSEDEMEGRRKKKASSYVRKRGPDTLSDNEEETDCPLMATVRKMKKKKKDKKKLSELEEEARNFLGKMDAAADEDEKSYQERKPATKKLSILSDVLEKLANKEFTRPLLDYDLLSIIKRWIQPLPSGKLSNVTVRQRLLESLKDMTGEQGINPSDLKRSSLGKTVMQLFTHRDETPNMKRQLKDLIEQWSRPIFQKSGNMKDLELVGRDRREYGIAGIARAQQATSLSSASSSHATKKRGMDSTLMRGMSRKKGGANIQQNKSNRVSVPYSKGFQFTIRPADRISTADAKEKNKRVSVGGTDGAVGRDFISRRMLDKSRKFSKNQRSTNVSVEGRATK